MDGGCGAGDGSEGIGRAVAIGYRGYDRIGCKYPGEKNEFQSKRP